MLATVWWVCGLCDFCSFVFCVVHAGMDDDVTAFVVVVVCVGCVFVIEGAWWMPWHAEPMKDVKGCVKPRGVVN